MEEGGREGEMACRRLCTAAGAGNWGVGSLPAPGERGVDRPLAAGCWLLAAGKRTRL